MDVGLGMIASTVANVHRGKDAKAFTALDFAPYLRKAEDDEADPAQAETPMQFLKGIGHG
mgnify:CR=1 FL=1